MQVDERAAQGRGVEPADPRGRGEQGGAGPEQIGQAVVGTRGGPPHPVPSSVSVAGDAGAVPPPAVVTDGGGTGAAGGYRASLVAGTSGDVVLPTPTGERPVVVMPE